MTTRPLLPILLLAACSPAPVANQPAAAPPSGLNLQTELTMAHNRERSRVGVPPLHWDSQLAEGAAHYARQLAAIGRMQHALPQSRPGQGENLWMGTRGAYSPGQMAASWVSEKALFRPGVFPAVSRSGNWAAVGHYSQMIWPTTTRLGCAVAGSRSHDFLVCRYAPAGNVVGRRVP